ncbi:uncharacterized protein BJ171DRAFT_455983 [Polychytrium aggregatum]|uniref:uncharacterized protein n=1 Tax=Polychytrium aggregatum TaxID=110093 RepID=UPI0022FDC5AF|nr:uncharacterized protein BJ171DRAFT_455983 [Polychytrium aggregatum]KAI9208014.1 hypothetical protein BJ171DRAFT_455983 [Polychytrium aggregatum]
MISQEQVPLAASIAGAISVSCWVVVYTPQIWENYCRKSTQGLSLMFVIIWMLGDLFSLIGSLMNKLILTVYGLAIYYLFMDVILLWQYVRYRPVSNPVLVSADAAVDDRTRLLAEAPEQPHPNYQTNNPSVPSGSHAAAAATRTAIVLTGLVFLSQSAATPGSAISGRVFESSILEDIPEDTLYMANLMGYLSAILYVLSRIPQIVENFRNKSCEGLSLLMFLFSTVGNVTYCMSILLVSLEPEYLARNVPWLLGSAGTLLFDGIIFIQFFAYRHRHRHVSVSPAETDCV